MNEKRILLIEDREDNAAALEDALYHAKRFQCSVVCAKDFREYEAKQLDRQSFDLAILDLVLANGEPSFAGLKGVILNLKKANPEAAAFIFSAYDESSYIVKAMKSGATDYIVKGQGGIHAFVVLLGDYFKRRDEEKTRTVEFDKFKSENMAGWRSDYPGKTLVIIGGKVEIIARSRGEAWIRFEDGKASHPDEWEEQDVAMVDIPDGL